MRNANGPHLAEYLGEMNREVLSKYDDMSVGEATGTTLAQTNSLVDDRRHELNMIQLRRDQAWPHRLRAEQDWRLVAAATQGDLRRPCTVLTKHDWDTVFLSNHDNPRIVSTFGDDAPLCGFPPQALRDHDSHPARNAVFV